MTEGSEQSAEEVFYPVTILFLFPEKKENTPGDGKQEPIEQGTAQTEPKVRKKQSQDSENGSAEYTFKEKGRETGHPEPVDEGQREKQF